MSEPTELKPCPFCGEKPQRIGDRVTCLQCHHIAWCDEHAWNRRAPSTEAEAPASDPKLRLIESLLECLRIAGAPVDENGDIEPVLAWSRKNAEERDETERLRLRLQISLGGCDAIDQVNDERDALRAEVDRLTAELGRVAKHLSDQCDATAKWEDECERLRAAYGAASTKLNMLTIEQAADRYAAKEAMDKADRLKGELATAKEEICQSRERWHGIFMAELEGAQKEWYFWEQKARDSLRKAEALALQLNFAEAGRGEVTAQLERVTKVRDEWRRLLEKCHAAMSPRRYDAKEYAEAFQEADAALARQGEGS